MRMIMLHKFLLSSILLVCEVAGATPKLRTYSPRDHADQKCDYVVVGGGTAGKYANRECRKAH